MPGCAELRRLPKASGITSVIFRRQTPGKLNVSSSSVLPRSCRLDPHHPIDHDRQRQKAWIRQTDSMLTLMATPMGLLLPPGKAATGRTMSLQHQPYLDLPFDPWYDRVARARATGRNGGVAPMIPVNPPKAQRIPMSLQFLHGAKTRAQMRSRFSGRVKTAITMIVVRGAYTGRDKRLAFDSTNEPETWLLPGWTYALQYRVEAFGLDISELVSRLEPMLRRLYQEGSENERRWAQISQRLPIPNIRDRDYPVRRPQSVSAPDVAFDPFRAVQAPAYDPFAPIDQHQNAKTTASPAKKSKLLRADNLPPVKATGASAKPAPNAGPVPVHEGKEPRRNPRVAFGLSGSYLHPAEPRPQRPSPKQQDIPPRRDARTRFGLRSDDPDAPMSSHNPFHKPFVPRTPSPQTSPPTSAYTAPALFPHLEKTNSNTHELSRSILSALDTRFRPDADGSSIFSTNNTEIRKEKREAQERDALGFVISDEMKDAWQATESKSRSRGTMGGGGRVDKSTSTPTHGRMTAHQARLYAAEKWAAREQTSAAARPATPSGTIAGVSAFTRVDRETEMDLYGFPTAAESREEILQQSEKQLTGVLGRISPEEYLDKGKGK
ncbi:hypothetical protein MKEN_01096700 [Mycena kentingensis (nom. inval.)]|nr:hypothetical protein MKEN_01096700 [Mycena kentingensis (nom. inval.)]